MAADWHALVPEGLHDAVRAALSSVYGQHAVDCLGPIGGGASGAIALRLRSDGHDHLLRVEVHKHPARNPHQYRCMQIAADAGLAPPLHYVDADNGVAVMDFVPAVPLDQYPGGKLALLQALGSRARELQATLAFPEFWDFRESVGRLLGVAERCFVPGLLDPHRAAYERLCASLDWDRAGHVSSHNDPNAHNWLFDGERLWLIDWETAYRNDPMVDVAILADNFAEAPEHKQALTNAWLGRPASADEAVRIEQVTLLTRLYYAGLLFALSGTPAGTLTDLTAPSQAEFAAKVAGLSGPTPQVLADLARMRLRDFIDGWAALVEQGPL